MTGRLKTWYPGDMADALMRDPDIDQAAHQLQAALLQLARHGLVITVKIDNSQHAHNDNVSEYILLSSEMPALRRSLEDAVREGLTGPGDG